MFKVVLWCHLNIVQRGVAVQIIERVLEAILFVVAAQSGLRLFEADGEAPVALARRLIRRRLPVTAIVITALLAAGGLLQAAWPGALDALRQQPQGAWWRTFTAPFVQTGGGLAGALFNIATAAIILALAEWQWGRLAAAAVWLTGAWAPVGDVAKLAGYHVSASHASAYSAGSSGATYFTAATLCAALLCGGPLLVRGTQSSGAGRARLLGLVGPAIALVMWIATNDGHGVLFTEGFVLGLLLRAALLALRIPPPPTASTPRAPATSAPHDPATDPAAFAPRDPAFTPGASLRSAASGRPAAASRS
jgi:hypothetical protein